MGLTENLKEFEFLAAVSPFVVEIGKIVQL
jgi:hypothetical protein